LDAKLDALYAGTSLDDAAARLGWLEADRAAIEASDDPALRLAVAMMPVVLAEEAEEKARAGRIAALRPRYMQAMIDFNASQGRQVYLAATASLPITCGTVRGYSPPDGVRLVPFTTLEGLVDTGTGEDPFASPQSQLAAIADGRGERSRMASLG